MQTVSEVSVTLVTAPFNGHSCRAALVTLIIVVLQEEGRPASLVLSNPVGVKRQVPVSVATSGLSISARSAILRNIQCVSSILQPPVLVAPVPVVPSLFSLEISAPAPPPTPDMVFTMRSCMSSQIRWSAPSLLDSSSSWSARRWVPMHRHSRQLLLLLHKGHKRVQSVCDAFCWQVATVRRPRI